MTIAVPLRLLPHGVQRVWGGVRLAGLVADPLTEAPPIGEVWICSDRDERDSTVRGGPFDSRTLRGLMLSEREAVLGDAKVGQKRAFPLLVKLLDAAKDLSIQVHPDRAASARLKSESKEECWYVLHAEPKAQIYLGLREGVDAREFAACAGTPDILDVLQRFDVKSGDFVHVPAGTVHGIGAGITLLEVQENSDTTYRFYDYDRLGLDGKPRELHIDAGLTSMDFESRPAGPVRPRFEGLGRGESVDRRAVLADAAPFRVDLFHLHRGARIAGERVPAVLFVLSGTGTIQSGVGGERARIGRGECWLVPADAPDVTVSDPSGDLTLLRAVPARAGL